MLTFKNAGAFGTEYSKMVVRPTKVRVESPDGSRAVISFRTAEVYRGDVILSVLQLQKLISELQDFYDKLPSDMKRVPPESLVKGALE